MADNLKASILSALECPVCVNYMAPPIRQCQGGHAICQGCFDKVDFCPVCRNEKNQVARCWTLERVYLISQIPCKYSFAGCTFSCRGAKISEHHQRCIFKIRSCPFVEYEECAWNSTISDLEAHLVAKHPTKFFQRPTQTLVFRNFREIVDSYYVHAVFQTFGEYFRFNCDLDTTTGMTRWGIYLLGSLARAQDFTFQLVFTSPEGDDEHMVLKALCSAAPGEDRENDGDYNYFEIQRESLANYCMGMDLCCDITITNTSVD